MSPIKFSMQISDTAKASARKANSPCHPRLDPAKFAGLAEGDAHVIRNAGGRASEDAIRPLAISYKLLGTRESFVIHHTDCGMRFFTNNVMQGLLANSLETAELGADGFRNVGQGPGSRAGEYIDWLTISDPEQAVIDDVSRIRNHPLVPATIPIYGYIYDVKTGGLVEVEQATDEGKASSYNTKSLYNLLYRQEYTKLSKDTITLRQLSAYLRMRFGQVHGWVEQGLLKAKRYEFKSGSVSYRVSLDQIRKFCKKHENLIITRRTCLNRMRFLEEVIFAPKHADLVEARQSKNERKAFERGEYLENPKRS